jgi:predicted transcriptional regulator
MEKKSINPYWFGGKFLEYCVKKGWLIQEGSGGRGTKWYFTEKGRKELKEEFGIEEYHEPN